MSIVRRVWLGLLFTTWFKRVSIAFYVLITFVPSNKFIFRHRNQAIWCRLYRNIYIGDGNFCCLVSVQWQLNTWDVVFCIEYDADSMNFQWSHCCGFNCIKCLHVSTHARRCGIIMVNNSNQYVIPAVNGIIILIEIYLNTYNIRDVVWGTARNSVILLVFLAFFWDLSSNGPLTTYMHCIPWKRCLLDL